MWKWERDKGVWGFLILKKLMSMKQYFPEGVKLPFVYGLLPSVTRSYVITDFTSESILKMKSHKWYADFVSQGVVDFAVVDCEDIPSVVLAFLRNA